MLQPLRQVRKGYMSVACPSGKTKPIPRSMPEREGALCKTKPIGPAPTEEGRNRQGRPRNWLRFCRPVFRMSLSNSFPLRWLRSFRPEANWVRFAYPSRLKLDASNLILPTIGFVSHDSSGRAASWAVLTCPAFLWRSRLRHWSGFSRREGLYLAQSRRDAECGVNRILPFSASPRLGASQFRLRSKASPGPPSAATRTASLTVARIHHP